MYTKQISLGTDPRTGKRIRKRIYADSPNALKQKENEAQREFARKWNPQNITFGTYSQRWFDTYISVLSEGSIKHYKTALNKCTALRPMLMGKITTDDLQAVVKESWNTPASCLNLVQTLKQIWRYAMGSGVVNVDVTLNLKRPMYKSKPRRFLTEKELDAVDKADFTPLETLYVNILRQFGLRPGEAMALTIDDIGTYLNVSKNAVLGNGSYRIKATKTLSTRQLPIPDSVRPKIQPVTDTYYLFEPVLKESVAFFRSIIKKIKDAYGEDIPDFVLYLFRHTKASQLYYIPGVSMKAKAAYMGHSEEMFIRTYSHMIKEREDMDALNEASI